ncbi:MAG: hypothetical protein HZA13_00915 [Nitrospirae bacterium]|nr:hypothetical protein [Nitrospirota bacterium]
MVQLSTSALRSYQAKAIKERLHLESLGSLVGESKSFLRIVEKILLFVNVDAPVLILGVTPAVNSGHHLTHAAILFS